MNSERNGSRTFRSGLLCTAVVWGIACSGNIEETTSQPEVATARQEVVFGKAGFAWVQSDGTVGTPWAYNSSGGAIVSGHPSTGLYNVTFKNLFPGLTANSQVTAYGSGNAKCKLVGYQANNNGVYQDVMCTNPAGQKVNSAFVLQVASPPGGGAAGAFLFDNSPSSGSSTADPTYSWNSTGGSNTIVRPSAGLYQVHLPGLGAWAGTVQVSALSWHDYDTPDRYCNTQGWGPSGSEQVVTVRCFNSSGTLSDSPFTLRYFAHGNVSTWDMGAYAWADNMTASSYTPNTGWSYDSGTVSCSLGSNTAGKTALGQYFVRHSLLPSTGSAVHVTAYGNNSNYCKVWSWGADGNGTRVNTLCFNSAGSAVDSVFVETYAINGVRGPC